ncbi:MAG TPA: hypothetical protein VKZ67_08850 [Natronosporangium sp.]|nr:hypothetical protein [Natronosporangium sp.]
MTTLVVSRHDPVRSPATPGFSTPEADAPDRVQFAVSPAAGATTGAVLVELPLAGGGLTAMNIGC